jgi:hypothetical protein
MRDEQNHTGSVLIYDLTSKSFIDTIPAYPKVQMTDSYDYRDVRILNEQESENNDSRLQFVNINQPKHVILSDTTISGGANHLLFNVLGQDIQNILTCYESGDLKIFDGYNNCKVVNFNIPNKKGARESKFDRLNFNSNILYTSSYDGYIYSYDISKSKLGEKLKAYGKAEGFDIDRGFFVIATPYLENSDAPDSTITLYTRKPTSVDEDNNFINSLIYPNPATDYIEISSINPTLKHGVDEEDYEIQIFDMLGIAVSPAGGRIKEGGRIDISNLSPGIYFIKIGNRVEKFVKK